MDRIEEKYGLKKSHAIALFVVLLLNVCWVIGNTFLLIQQPANLNFVIVTYIQFVLALYYACYGYKVPHGNLMRYLLLFYVATLGVMLVMNASFQGTLYNATYSAIIILVAYMAGRLNKFKQNIVICLIVLALKIVNAYPYLSFHIRYYGFSFMNFFGSIGPIAVWLAIAGAYLARYEIHKEEGLLDK